MAKTKPNRFTEKCQFLVDAETKKRISDLPKDVQYGRVARAAIVAWLDKQLHVDDQECVTLGKPEYPTVRATPKTEQILGAIAIILAKPASQRSDIEKLLVLGAQEATGIKIEK